MALGVRAQYVTIAMLGLLLVSQVIGVAIFSGKALAYAPNEFVTTWKTDNSGPANAITLTTPANLYTYDYHVDWGDGNADSHVTDTITHVYSVAGTYTVKITGVFPMAYFGTNQVGYGYNTDLITVEQWGSNQWLSAVASTGMFEEVGSLAINAIDTPDLSQTTSLANMFRDTTMNSDISNWDVSHVTDMSYMFYENPSFNKSLSNWDVSHVTTISGMFGYASAFNQSLSNWNTSGVKDMSYMFAIASSFNQPLSNWDVSHVANMSGMFDGTTAFNQPLSAWNVSSVTDMSDMFYRASLFNQPLINWDVSNVTSMANMFGWAGNFNQSLASWDVSSATDMDMMFGGNSGLSVYNYDATLVSWSALPLQQDVTFGAGLSRFCSSTAYKQAIDDSYGWIITDNGANCTGAITRPLITTNAPSSLTTGAVVVEGNVVSDGGSSITAAGFEYGITSSFDSTTGSVSTSIGQFSASLNSLACGTSYYYRAYATNSQGTAYGANRNFTTISCPDFSITTDLPDAWVGALYGQPLATENDTGTPVFSLSSGDLPPGLTLDSSGYIGGTPTTAGAYDFTLQADDGYQVATRSYHMMVDEFRIITTSLPSGEVGAAYTTGPIEVAGIKGGLFGCGVSNNADLPPGLYVQSTTNDCHIEGTPTTAGTYPIHISAYDSSFAVPYAEHDFTITIAPQTTNIHIVTDTLPDSSMDSYYYSPLEITGNSGGYSCSIADGSLPPGLTIDSYCRIVGSPNYQYEDTNRTFTFTVQATDYLGSVTKELSIYVGSPDVIQLNGTTLDDGRVGEEYYSSSISAYSGFGPKTYEVTSGSLPDGLELDPMYGTVTGTPTAAGSSTVNVTATDLTGSSTASYSIEILPPRPPRTNTPIVSITSPTNGASFNHDQDTIIINGTGPSNRTITTYMDNYELGTTTTDGNGHWQYIAHNVFPGNHNFTAKWIPGGDLAVIPYQGGEDDNYNFNVEIIDTSTKQVIKKVYMPDGATVVGVTLNHAGTKAYLSGSDYVSGQPSVWELDLSNGLITGQLSTAGYTNGYRYYGPLVISEDDRSAYVSAIADDTGDDLRNFAIENIDLTTLTRAGNPRVIAVGNQEATTRTFNILLAQSGNTLYSPVSTTDDDNLQTVSTIDLLSNIVSSIAIGDEPRWDRTEPLVKSAGDKIYYTINNKLVEVNPHTNTVSNEFTVPDVTQDANYPYNDQYGFSAMAIDSVHHKAYLAAHANTDPNKDMLYVIDMITKEVTRIDLPSRHIIYGLSLTSDGGQLYAVYSEGDIGVQVLNTSTLELESDTDNLLASRDAATVFGNFIGRTIAPQANVSFTVATAPAVDPPVDPPITPKTPTVPTDPTPKPPTVTDATPGSSVVPQVTSQGTPPKNSKFVTSPNTSAAPNSLFALARRIPEPLAIGFPWLLLLLALTLVSIQYYQVHSEGVATRKLQADVERQNRLVDEQNNFVALTTHYLHTPLTVMEGEISLMVRAGTITQAEATKLQTTLTGLSAQAEAVLAQEEGNV